jgi:FAD/FMN-containing dehydrogenase
VLNSATDDFKQKLRGLLPQECFKELTKSYLEEPRGQLFGSGGLLLAPDNTEDVTKIVKACSDARVGIVPYGGGTGLVGGQIYSEGLVPVILSTQRMNKVRSIWIDENIILVEAGSVLKDIQDRAESAGCLFPLSLASEGSARIGGNLATNAGGVNVVRYGSTRDLCLGVEAVMPDGSIFNGLSRLRKDNTGYDIKNLLIGSEGTLGIITAASLKLFPRPEVESAALFVVRDPRAAIDLFAMCRDKFGNGLNAFELINGVGLKFLSEVGPKVRQPFSYDPEWIVLLDVGFNYGIDPEEVLEKLFIEAEGRDLVSDGLVAQSLEQRLDFWKIRESIPEANHRIGAISSSDLSVPISLIPEFITKAGKLLSKVGDFRINCFGHIGDGNIHYNIFPVKGENREIYKDKSRIVNNILYDLVDQLEGSFSAEHGIGRLKVNELCRYSDPTKFKIMKNIKSALDPLGIMNPGVIF